MARRPSLEVDGVTYKNVQEVSYETNCASDETGRPSDCARGGLIRIMRESDENTELANWAFNSDKEHLRGGKVHFKNSDDSEMKILEWKDGFITHYEEHVPHIKHNSDDQSYEYMEISCKSMAIGSVEIDNRWEE
jgi:hypothetical protein